MPIRILIASDHSLTRTGLRQILKAVPGFQIVAEAEAPGAVAELCRRFSPHVIVFEITAPGTRGLRTTAALVRAVPQARIVAVATNENAYYMRSLLAAGVVGYVLRRASHEELVEAVHNAFSGRRYLDPRLSDGVAELLLQKRRPQAAARPGGLGRREVQVLRAVARGFTSREIAGHLRLSGKTVETYRSRIYQKLGLRTRADLVHYATAAGLLQGNGEEEE